jgi:hypothetical protein
MPRFEVHGYGARRPHRREKPQRKSLIFITKTLRVSRENSSR